MTKHTFASPARRPHAIAVNPTRRVHRREVIRWALANRLPIDRDALAVVIGLRPMLPDGCISTRWTEADVGSLLMFDFNSWCNSRGCGVPSGADATLTTYFQYLSTHKLLRAESPPASVLIRSIGDYIDEGAPGSTARRNHPAERSRHLAPVLPIS